ncbi:MAG: aminopeptidase N C-terminal domain-containing protein, partial [Planctomycetota bacterium]
NMTDAQAALACLCANASSERDKALAAFHERWKDEALVLDKWFTLQAMSRTADAARMDELRAHPDFTLDNPNRARSLVGAFAMGNFRGFHAEDGAGYRFLADVVIALDPKNPQVASRLVRALTAHERFEEPWAGRMRGELERIRAQDGLSKDVFEIVAAALG